MSIAEIIQVFWFLTWSLAIVAFFFVGLALFEECIKKDGKAGLVALLFIPILLVIGSPVYLESITNNFIVFSKDGNYKYTVKPNIIGIIPQGDWDTYSGDGNRMINTRAMQVSSPYETQKSSISIKASATNGWVATIIYTGQNSENDLRARAEKFVSLGIQEQEIPGATLKDLTLSLVKDSSAYSILQVVLNSYSPDGGLGVLSLREKIALLSSLETLDQDLRKYGLQIMDIDLQRYQR